MSIVSIISIVSTGVAHELHTKTGKATHFCNIFLFIKLDWFDNINAFYAFKFILRLMVEYSLSM